jgi:hypothetical protein
MSYHQSLIISLQCPHLKTKKLRVTTGQTPSVTYIPVANGVEPGVTQSFSGLRFGLRNLSARCRSENLDPDPVRYTSTV